jgi:hypothetical protein
MEQAVPRYKIHATGVVTSPKEKYDRLKDAVEKLYYAAYWSPDRNVDADTLWKNVRDAAELPEGNSPKPITDETINN